MQIGIRQYIDLLLKLSLSASLAACITRSALAAPQAKSKTNVSTNKSSPGDLPDGTLDLTDLWPSPLQPAVESDTLALQPTLSVAGGSGGANTPSFTGDPSFDGDTFEVNGQNDIIIPYFQLADQMRLDFEDGHQLQGPPEQPTQIAIKKIIAPKSPKTIPAVNTVSARFHGTAFWNGGNSIFNAAPFVLAGDSIPNPAYYSNNYGLMMGFAPFLPGSTKPSRRDFIQLSYSGQSTSSLVNNYGLVPTDLERQGNFSQLTNSDGSLIPIYPPRSFTPYPNNTINTPLNAAAVALLQYLPRPNLNSTGLNYRLLTTQGTHGTSSGASYTHQFGPVSATGKQMTAARRNKSK
jgi:hypothetical protein